MSTAKAVIVGAALGTIGATTAAVAIHGPHAATAAAPAPACNVGSLKGTYSTLAVGFAPQPPAPIPPYVIGLGQSFPLQAIGQFTFDGAGNSSGYVHENVGGKVEEAVPSKGSYTLAPGPNGIGCQGTWVLQDRHTLPEFKEEGPHFFRITLARDAKGFHFLTFGGGPGPAVLSGFAERDTPISEN